MTGAIAACPESDSRVPLRALCAVIGVVATSMLTDYTNKDISAEYAGV